LFLFSGLEYKFCGISAAFVSVGLVFGISPTAIAQANGLLKKTFNGALTGAKKSNSTQRNAADSGKCFEFSSSPHRRTILIASNQCQARQK
jgi:hypothetical protein